MLTVLVLLLVGVLVGRLGVLPEGSSRVLDTFVIKVALPALVLSLVPELELTRQAAVPVVVAWSGLALSAALVLLASRLFGWDRRTTGTLLVVVPLGNTSFLGIPAVETLLGADHLPYAVVYDQLGSFLGLTTYAAFVAGRYGAVETPHLRDTLLRLVRFPAFVALLVGLVLMVTGVPGVIAEVTERIGAAVTPLGMLAVGMRLRPPDPEGSHAPLAVGLVVRLLVVPAAAYGVMVALRASGAAWDAAILEAAMPPMVTASVLATDAGLDEHLAANLAGVGVIAAMATLPLAALLLSP